MKKKNFNPQKSQIRLAIVFLIPWVIGFLVFNLYPIVSTVYYSFTKYNLVTKAKWIGFSNFHRMLSDDVFWKSVYNSFYFVIIGVSLQIALSVLSAVLLNMNIKGKSFFRTIYYLPAIVPPVASSLVWMWLLNPQYGLVNSFLRFFNLPQPLWLSSAEWSKPAIILMALWAIGNTMVVYLAAVGDIPKDYYEAMDIDGAGPWTKFWKITWPMLSNVTLFQVINGIIVGFNTFTQSFIVAASSQKGNGSLGGVQNSLMFYAVNIYNEGFRYLNFGYASALSTVMLIGMIIVTALIFKSSKKWVYYGGK
ncbi:carbohydrate ABC transporter permease [Caproiciproducens sp.]|uniref:carbohydrate ABC transporter permease n=1 Tax=Caproiciproducens sp. TaxID=1954376 RepID=UPI00289B064C|nr:sugar ABC transporter permease [Caproiciproducens sp.]